ncbi:hypothetical protein C8R44DRAFT_762504 [Mycena epipterygia]|nr:hypothetical protein C8R44DRAFT_762504 [Mycena epipterygia]
MGKTWLENVRHPTFTLPIHSPSSLASWHPTSFCPYPAICYRTHQYPHPHTCALARPN